MALIRTIHGMLEESTLTKIVGHEDRTYPDRAGEYVTWIEWKQGDEIVRRDAHVILKEPSVVADAIAASVQ